ncbi:MAG: hypothetical protein GY940_37465 [bacterium]|nr:hypothetical protein [bacterium]
MRAGKKGVRFDPVVREYTRDIVKLSENYRAELNWKFFISVTDNWFVPSQRNFSDIYDSGVGLQWGYVDPFRLQSGNRGIFRRLQ